MEGDGVPWGSEPVSGPGPGGGGMIRELCRGFGRYRRYLGRLRQNLRETQKFFRDIKCSHSHSCPSSPTGGGGGAERGPAGDVAEPGLQAGKESSGGGDRAGGASWRADRNPVPAEQAGKGRKVGAGRRGGATGPGPSGSARPWAGIPRGGGERGARGGRPELRERAEGRRASGPCAGAGVPWGTGRVAPSGGWAVVVGDPPRDGGVGRQRKSSRRGAPGARGGQGTGMDCVCCARVCDYVQCFCTNRVASL